MRSGITIGIAAVLPPIAENAETPTSPGLNDGTKKALERAVEASKKLQHRYIGTEHLLLGLLHDEAIIQTLQQWNITPEQVSQEVDLVLSAPRT